MLKDNRRKSENKTKEQCALHLPTGSIVEVDPSVVTGIRDGCILPPEIITGPPQDIFPEDDYSPPPSDDDEEFDPYLEEDEDEVGIESRNDYPHTDLRAHCTWGNGKQFESYGVDAKRAGLKVPDSNDIDEMTPNKSEADSVFQRKSKGAKPDDMPNNTEGCHSQCRKSDAWYYIKVKSKGVNGTTDDTMGLLGLSYIKRSGGRSTPLALSIVSPLEYEQAKLDSGKKASERDYKHIWDYKDFLWKVVEINPGTKDKYSDAKFRDYKLINYGLYTADIYSEVDKSEAGIVEHSACIGSFSCGGLRSPDALEVVFRPNSWNSKAWKDYKGYDKDSKGTNYKGLTFRFDDYVLNPSGTREYPSLVNTMRVYQDDDNYRNRPLVAVWNDSKKDKLCHHWSIMYLKDGSWKGRKGVKDISFEFHPTADLPKDINFILVGGPEMNYYECYSACCSNRDNVSSPEFSKTCDEYINKTLSFDSNDIYGVNITPDELKFRFFKLACELPDTLTKDNVRNVIGAVESDICMFMLHNHRAVDSSGNYQEGQYKKMCKSYNDLLEKHNGDANGVIDELGITVTEFNKLGNICACHMPSSYNDKIIKRIAGEIDDQFLRRLFLLLAGSTSDRSNPRCWMTDCQLSPYKRQDVECQQVNIIGCWQKIINSPGTDPSNIQECKIGRCYIECFCRDNPEDEICLTSYAQDGSLENAIGELGEILYSKGFINQDGTLNLTENLYDDQDDNGYTIEEYEDEDQEDDDEDQEEDQEDDDEDQEDEDQEEENNDPWKYVRKKPLSPQLASSPHRRPTSISSVESSTKPNGRRSSRKKSTVSTRPSNQSLCFQGGRRKKTMKPRREKNRFKSNKLSISSGGSDRDREIDWGHYPIRPVDPASVILGNDIMSEIYNSQDNSETPQIRSSGCACENVGEVGRLLDE